jgi:hypothetical protein
MNKDYALTDIEIRIDLIEHFITIFTHSAVDLKLGKFVQRQFFRWNFSINAINEIEG